MKKLQNQFVYHLEQCARKSKRLKSVKEVFDAFIHLNVQLCLQTNNSSVYKHELNHDLYKQLKPIHLTKNEISLLLEASLTFYQMISEAEPFDDVLGEMYDSHLGKILGQFFTPKKLGDSLSNIFIENIKKETEKPFYCGDMTGCGAGGLILSQLKAILEKHGKFGLINVNVTGMDVCEEMVQLTMIQILAHIQIHKIPIMSFSMFWGDSITGYGKEENMFFSMKMREQYFQLYYSILHLGNHLSKLK